MHRLKFLAGGPALPPRRCFDPKTMNCLGNVRFRSRPTHRPSKSDRQKEGRVDRSRRNGQTNGRRGHGGRRGDKRPPRMMYYVIPEAPSPPKFDLQTLGMGWTRPSQPASEHPAVEKILTTGALSTTIRHCPSTLNIPGTGSSFLPPEEDGVNVTVNGYNVDSSPVSSITTLFDKFQSGEEAAEEEEDANDTDLDDRSASMASILPGDFFQPGDVRPDHDQKPSGLLSEEPVSIRMTLEKPERIIANRLQPNALECKNDKNDQESATSDNTDTGTQEGSIENTNAKIVQEATGTRWWEAIKPN